MKAGNSRFPANSTGEIGKANIQETGECNLVTNFQYGIIAMQRAIVLLVGYLPTRTTLIAEPLLGMQASSYIR